MICKTYIALKINNKKYQNYDPFVEADNEPNLIGIGIVEHRCTLHRLPLNDNPKIFDFRKKLLGSFHVELLPCDKQGIAFTDEIERFIIHEPEKQLKELHFLIKLNNLKLVSGKFRNLYAQFKLYGKEQFIKTNVGENSFADFQTIVSFDNVELDVRFIFETENPLFS